MLTFSRPAQSLRLVCCTVGDQTYCMDMSAVVSIERADFLQINPARQGPAGWLLGREQETPVFSLASRVNGQVAQSHSPMNRIIMIPASPATWGLLVESVSRLVEATVGDLLPLPPVARDSSTSLFLGAVKTGDRLMLLLDPNRLNKETTYRSAAERTVSLKRPFRGFNGKSRQLELARRAFSRANTEQRENEGRVLIFATAATDANGRPLLFGLSVKQVLQILDPRAVTPVPAAPSHVAGVFNWRNHVVPLVDIEFCIGGKPENVDLRNRIIVARAPMSRELVGFRVRPGVRVESLPLDCQPLSADEQPSNPAVRAFFSLNDQTLAIPDLDAMVDAGSSTNIDIDPMLMIPGSVAVS